MTELGFDAIFLLRIALINSQKTAAFVWLDSSQASFQRAPGGTCGYPPSHATESYEHPEFISRSAGWSPCPLDHIYKVESGGRDHWLTKLLWLVRERKAINSTLKRPGL